MDEITALTRRLEELNRGNEALRKENFVLNSYIQRHVSAEDALVWGFDDPRAKRKDAPKRPSRLTLDQKLDVLSAEVESMKRENAASEASAQRLIDTLKAVVEQTDTRISRLKHEAYSFKRDVVVNGENKRTGKVMAERLLRYYEDQIRHKEATIDKLRLKCTSLRTQQARLETRVKQKEESGDVLHYIDFHQLQIENKQYHARLNEKTVEHLRLKVSTGRTVRTLNTLKSKLLELTRATARCKADIKARTQLLHKLRSENENLNRTVTRAKQLGMVLTQQARDVSDLPTVLDYVELKVIQGNLTKDVASWARKVEIATLAAKQARARLRESGLSRGSSFGGSAPRATAGIDIFGRPTAKSTKAKLYKSQHVWPGNGTLLRNTLQGSIGHSRADIPPPPKGVAGFAGANTVRSAVPVISTAAMSRPKAGLIGPGNLRLGLTAPFRNTGISTGPSIIAGPATASTAAAPVASIAVPFATSRTARSTFSSGR